MRSRRLSRRIIFSRQLIDFGAERKEIERYRSTRIQVSLPFSQLSVTKSEVVDCTKSGSRYWKQQAVKPPDHAFPESLTKVVFRFLTQAGYESRRTNFGAEATVTVVPPIQNGCGGHGHSAPPNQMRRSRLQRSSKPQRRSILTRSRTSMLKDIGHLKELRC